jgi:hypothetical protein
MIGKIREYEGEIYISPEIVREIEDPNLLALHKYERHLAILRFGNQDAPPKKAGATDDTLLSFDESDGKKASKATSTDLIGISRDIMQFITDNDNPDGIMMDEIVAHFEEHGIDSIEINMKIFELIEDEMVTELSPGVYRPLN